MAKQCPNCRSSLPFTGELLGVITVTEYFANIVQISHGLGLALHVLFAKNQVM